MGEVVAAIGLSHAPGLRAWPEAVKKEQLQVIEDAFRSLEDQLARLKPDVVVMIGPEHWANFSLANMPAFCIGLADSYRGPVEEWLRVPATEVPGSPSTGREIVDRAFIDGIDVSFSYELNLDHAFMVPLSYLFPGHNVPIVPIIENCLVEPMPRPQRSYALGMSLAHAIQQSDKRVAVIATGGLSHWPGEREHGRVNGDFDKSVLDALAGGRGDELSNWSHEQLAMGGTGAHELRAWISMLATVPGAHFNVLFYEAVPPLATGCAAVSYFGPSS